MKIDYAEIEALMNNARKYNSADNLDKLLKSI